MLPQNIYSLLITDKDKAKLELALLKCAFQYADLGLDVWFVSPRSFDRLPPNIGPPDKEVLQLITFLYLKDRADLLAHLNGVHLWRKYPQVIIVNDYEHYCGDSPMMNAFIIVSVLDASVACANLHRTKRAYFLLSFAGDPKGLENVFDMYIRNIYKYEGDETELLQNIKESVTAL